MSDVTANGVNVIGGTINMPLVGRWTADLMIDQLGGTGFDAGTAVQIVTDAFTLNGVVAPNRTGELLDAMHIRVLGGKGGLAKTARAVSYVQPGAYVRDVLNGLCKDAGETLSSSSATAFTNTSLPAWSVMAQSVSQGLMLLISAVSPGLSWRFLPDGTLWIGTESWTVSTLEHTIMGQDPSDGAYELGVDFPAILPGMNLADVGNVARVEHHLDGSTCRSKVWIGAGIRGELSAMQSIATSATVKYDYSAHYICKVKAQSSDLTTADVVPLNKKLGGLQRVAVRFGTGVKVQLPVDSTVLLGWDGGDPRSPFIWGGLTSETVTRIQLGGNTDAARKNDPAGGGVITFTFVPGPTATLSIVYVPGDGSATQTLASGSGALSLKEKITAGSSVVGLG